AAGLVIGAIGRAGDLAVIAVLTAAGHPGFEVVFAVGRAAEVAGAGVDDVVREAEPLEDALLHAADFLVNRVALFRRAEREHLDLGELLHAIQAARIAAGGPGLGAEAVRQADVAFR